MIKTHRESLMRIPLVQQMLKDSGVRLVKRRVDSNWTYRRIIPIRMEGFAPASGEIYLGDISRAADWLLGPEKSARLLNAGDILVRDVLMMLHDYIHCWAYAAINELMPELGFGEIPNSSRELEDFTFCHILTEVAAVVGLDYWFLCRQSLNDFCNIDTRWRNLATNYDATDLPVFRKINSKFDPNEKDFYKIMTEFYCSGSFKGFSALDLLNPKLQNWLGHEASYSRIQRKNTRQWFSHISGLPISEDRLEAPLEFSEAWKMKLTQDLQELLWEKIFQNQLHSFKTISKKGPRRKENRKVKFDWRFLNLNALREGSLSKLDASCCSEEIFSYFFYQFVAIHHYESFDPELLKLFPFLMQKRDIKLILHLFQQQEKLQVTSHEPCNLFFLN